MAELSVNPDDSTAPVFAPKGGSCRQEFSTYR